MITSIDTKRHLKTSISIHDENYHQTKNTMELQKPIHKIKKKTQKTKPS